MANINKVVLVVAKVLEVLHWLMSALLVVMLVCSVAAKDWLGGFLANGILKADSMLSVYGFEVMLTDGSGAVNMQTVLLFSIGAFLIMVLMAMVFRNVYLIVRKSQNSTPFQKDNIRMVREIGIFSIAVPIVALIMSSVIRLVVGVDDVEISVRLGGLVMGIVVLGLSQFFAHGVSLEEDVDGLL